MKKLLIRSLFLPLLLVLGTGDLIAAQEKLRKILVIGVDGIINTALDYATTPGIDQILANGSYSMDGYSGNPAYSSTGWSTMLTGVPSTMHRVVKNLSFEGNNFKNYPSVVYRIKTANPSLKVASVVRTKEINEYLNESADQKYDFNSDAQVLQKSIEILKEADLSALFVQFSSPAETGNRVGYQLRQAQYVLAIQETDKLVGQLLETLRSRSGFANEEWAVFFVSTHGGTESGIPANNSEVEFNVPIIFSGGEMDPKQLVNTSLPAREFSDNILTIDRAKSGEKTYVRIPIKGTALQGMNKFTIEMWIKNGNNFSDPSIMGDKDWDSGGNPGFVITRSGAQWKINIANHKRERYDIGSPISLEDDYWHHLAISFDKTNECIVYHNGMRVNGEKMAYKPEDDMASPFNYICLGQEGTQRYAAGGPNWAGSFNEVRIWTDVLSLQTIRDYMYLRDIEKTSHPHLSSLNLYLKFDELRGTKITDYSGKGNHGELVGAEYQRHPYYAISLTDVAINVLSHMGIPIQGSWGLEGSTFKSNVPFRLFKVN